MAYGDSSVQNVLNELNNFLADHSYMKGFTPTKADLAVFEALGQQLPDEFPHIQRWYRHIESFDQDEKANWHNATMDPAVCADVVASATRQNHEVMDTEV